MHLYTGKQTKLLKVIILASITSTLINALSSSISHISVMYNWGLALQVSRLGLDAYFLLILFLEAGMLLFGWCYYLCHCYCRHGSAGHGAWVSKGMDYTLSNVVANRGQVTDLVWYVIANLVYLANVRPIKSRLRHWSLWFESWKP